MLVPIERSGPRSPAPDSPASWRMAWSAFVAGFVVLGVVYSYGAFLQPMIDEFSLSRVEASAFYAIASLIWYLLGPITGHLGDRFGPRGIVLVGAAAMGGGLVITALTHSVWIAYLAYGAGVGLGAACAYVPTLANLGGWFVLQRNKAFGVAAAGTGCGMLILPPLSAYLIDRIGWRLTDLILGVGSAALLSICAIYCRPPPIATRNAAQQPIRKILCSSEFLLFYFSWLFATTALFVPFVFLPQFAVQQGSGPIAASALLSILGGASVLGRLGISSLGDRINNLTLFKYSVAVMAASYVIWLVSPGYWWLVLFVAILGVAYGFRIALVPGVLIQLFGHLNLGILLGVFFTGTGVAAILGPALAGFIVDLSGSFSWGIAFALVMGAIGLIVLAPLSKRSAFVAESGNTR